jgi:hypothetical protein
MENAFSRPFHRRFQTRDRSFVGGRKEVHLSTKAFDLLCVCWLARRQNERRPGKEELLSDKSGRTSFVGEAEPSTFLIGEVASSVIGTTLQTPRIHPNGSRKPDYAFCGKRGGHRERVRSPNCRSDAMLACVEVLGILC